MRLPKLPRVYDPKHGSELRFAKLELWSQPAVNTRTLTPNQDKTVTQGWDHPRLPHKAA